MAIDQERSIDGSPVLKVTDAARALVLEARAGEPDGERLALFLEVSGVSDGAYTYDMWFEAASDAGAGDAVHHHDELVVVVAAPSVEKVAGATLDVAEQPDGPGLVIVNPNRPPTAPRPAPVAGSDLSGPVAQAVLAVLADVVNPQIAAHGGRADLVAVDEGVAYLRLGGGCQGCGLAQVTLSQGISVAIKEAVPEIVDVVDVTAHDAGTNPYFEGAKK